MESRTIIKNTGVTLLILLLIGMLCIQEQVYAQVEPSSYSEKTCDELEASEIFFQQNDDSFLSGDGTISPKSIGSGSFSVDRPKKTKLTFIFRTQFAPIPDKITIKSWKCIYNSTKKAWVTSGSATTNSYGGKAAIMETGSFAVNKDKSYKVKVSVTEKKGASTNTKVFYSKSI